MSASPDEAFRTLYVDPGEDTGWAIGKGLILLAAGQEKMWEFYDEVDAVLGYNVGMLAQGRIPDLRPGVDPSQNTGPIGRIVCEDWALYPWELKNMKWNKCRTARLIGGLEGLCRHYIIEMIFQPASIKSTAERTGVEQLFYRPLKENRHANDAMRHWAYFTQTEMLGVEQILVNS